jgi:TPR repeat protein
VKKGKEGVMRKTQWIVWTMLVMAESAPAQFGGGGITLEEVKASQDAMYRQMQQLQAQQAEQTKQFLYQMNNRPGMQDFREANACVRSDPERAFSLYQASAQAGWAAAYYQLARCYYNGTGTERDTKTGAQWLIKAANSDNEEAQLELARAYKTGNGVEPDQELAAMWARRSQQTLAAKQAMMSQILENGGNSSFQTSVSGTRDQILRSKIEREQRSLQDTENRLEQATRSGGSTTSLSGTADAQRRLIQSYQNQLSQ